jgi:hypothetical protein
MPRVAHAISSPAMDERKRLERELAEALWPCPRLAKVKLAWLKPCITGWLCAALLAVSLAFGVAAAADIQSYAIVQDDATLRVQGKTIRLYGDYVVDTRLFCDSIFRPPRRRGGASAALKQAKSGSPDQRPDVRRLDRARAETKPGPQAPERQAESRNARATRRDRPTDRLSRATPQRCA